MGAMRSIHQRLASGRLSSRTVSPVGAASTTIRSYSRWSDVITDPEQVAQLVHARQHGHLLGHHLVEAAPLEEAREVGLDRAPVARDVEEHVRLMGPQVRRDLARRGPDRHVQRVRQAVRDVGRDDQRAHAALGAQHGRRGGDARLADAALAGVDEDARHRASTVASARACRSVRDGNPLRALGGAPR